LKFVTREDINAKQVSKIIMGDDKVNYNSEFKSQMKYDRSRSDANLGHNNMASKGRETHWTTGDRN